MITSVMANPRNTRTKRVLVGSADTILLDRLARVLREAQCNVASTQRSGRLLYRALEDPFDLVVLDLDLKDLNGLEALQILGRPPIWPNIDDSVSVLQVLRLDCREH